MGGAFADNRPVFESLPGVLEVIPVTHGYKLAASHRGPTGEDGSHHDPDTALSDGPQSITPDMFDSLMGELRQMAPILGRSL